LKAVQHIVASSAEIIGAFNMGFGSVNLHRPTVQVRQPASGAEGQGHTLVHFFIST
jgi:hypothetical protein